MDKKEKGGKENIDVKAAAILDKAKTNWKYIAGVVVLLIILFNIVWTLASSRIAPLSEEVQKLKDTVAAFETRVAEAEKGVTVDADALKADVESIRGATTSFETKLNSLIQTEEAKLESLTKEVENQKAYLELLRNLAVK
ncbi:MAG: DUF2730 domain-containing protein [Synergistaceae bacterium]|nr:DUF2730 domain-containing protein [Synergistaceae bacterium]